MTNKLYCCIIKSDKGLNVTTKLGIRDITRNFSILDNYDYVKIEDKKAHKTKGFFVSQKYADEVKKLLEKKKRKDKIEKFNKLMEYISDFEIEDRFKDLSVKEIRAKITQKKYGK